MGIAYPLTPVFGEEKDGNAFVFEYGLFTKKILITGANGQLGNEMRLLAKEYEEFDFVFTDIDELDLSDAVGVMDYCEQLKPSYLINCAAYTAVDRAEEEKELCWKVNCQAVTNLAKAASKVGAKVLHVSTDYVFDGTNTKPYVETDPVCPVSTYGKSKLEGETTLMEHCPESVIVRTAWLYSIYGNNFVKTMIRLGKERDSISVVTDQIGSPTYARDLADALMDMVVAAEKGNFKTGIYHYSNEGICSWYDFTLKIHELAGTTNCKIIPVTTKEYPTKTIRPAYSVLSKEKIKADYGIIIPPWEESLADCIALL
jgi:dTDP-4-dehydrorhamnose reductase